MCVYVEFRRCFGSSWRREEERGGLCRYTLVVGMVTVPARVVSDPLSATSHDDGDANDGAHTHGVVVAAVVGTETSQHGYYLSLAQRFQYGISPSLSRARSHKTQGEQLTDTGLAKKKRTKKLNERAKTVLGKQ